jgi:hypothetical protein
MESMSTRTRIWITVASAAATAGAGVANQWSSGPGTHPWPFVLLGAYALAVVGAFLVGRWWALLPALSMTAIGFLAATIHPTAERWSSESIPATPGVVITVLVFLVLVQATLLSLGLLARWIWDAFRHPDLPATTPRGIVR